MLQRQHGCLLSAKSGHSESLANSIHRLRLRELPCAVQNLRAWTIEADHIVPAGHDRQAVGDLAVATAELNRNRTSVSFFAVRLLQVYRR
jgi:hypothetical protein